MVRNTMRESGEPPPFIKHFEDSFPQSAFFVYIPCGPPANHSAKGLEFPRIAKVISRMVWRFRAWRKSFPEWFGVSAHGESYFPNGLELVVAKIWKLTVQRNGHVRLLGHYYNVPHTYVGKKESMRKKIYERKEK